ncbi:MAG TPA: hypothetical protein VF472_07320 [Burkholderiaceae bacterium]
MPRVICTLPNASASINGVAFEPHELGVLSEEIEQDRADAFLRIDGYLDHAVALAAAVDGAPAVRPKLTIKKK